MSFRRSRNIELQPGMGVNGHFLKAIDSYREQMKLPKLQAKNRNCLKCGNIFLSDHAGVRLCPKHAGNREVARESKVIFG